MTHVPRVVHIVGRGDTYGGAQRYVESVARHQAEAGDEVTVWCGTGGVFAEHLAGIDIPVVLLEAERHNVASLVRRMSRQLRAAKPDLVVTHSTAMCVLVRLALLNQDIPLVLTVHGVVFGKDRPSWQRLGGAVIEAVVSRLRPCDLVAISERDKALLEGSVVGPKNRVHLVKNWVDDAPRSQPSTSQDASNIKRIGMVARFDRPKRPEVLVKALAGLPIPVRADFVGGGDAAPAQELAEDLGVADLISWHGEVDDVAEITQGWDLGVLVSDWEGLPLSVIEYLRDGLPIVASATGAVEELVDDGVNGILLRTDRPEELRSAMESILIDPELAEHMGSASRRRYEKSHSPSHAIPDLLGVYDYVRNRPKPELSHGTNSNKGMAAR